MSAQTLSQMNVGAPAYFSNNKPTINLIKASKWPDWLPGSVTYVSSDGWARSIADGASMPALTVEVNESGSGGPEYVYLRTGTYKLIWKGSATATITGAGMSGGAAGTPSAALQALGYDHQYTAVAGVNNPALTIAVSNSSGSAVDFAPTGSGASEPALYHADDEALFLTGEIFQPDFLATSKANVNRVMDIINANQLGWNGSSSTLATIAFSDFHAESDRSWGAEDFGAHANGIGFPPSVMGKLARKTGNDLWINIPVKCTNACIASIASAVATAMGAGTNRVWVEAGNENWNRASAFIANNEWLRDTKAATLTVVDTNGNASSADNDKVACAAADVASIAWDAFEAVLGRSRVVRVLCGQAVLFSTLAAMFEYTVAAAGPLARYGAVKMKTLVDQYGVADYFALATGSGVASVDQTNMMENKTYNNANSWWVNAMKYGVDYAKANYVTPNIASLAAKSATCQLAKYEGGQGAEVAVSPRYTFTLTKASSNTTIVSGADYSAGFDNGDAITIYGTSPSSSLIAALASQYKVRLSGGNTLKIYASDADYTSDTPAVFDQADGDYTVDNWTRLHALSNKIKDVLDSADGATVYTYYHAQCSDGISSTHAQYFDTFGYTLEFKWGLSKSQFLPKNAVQLLFDSWCVPLSSGLIGRSVRSRKRGR